MSASGRGEVKRLSVTDGLRCVTNAIGVIVRDEDDRDDLMRRPYLEWRGMREDSFCSSEASREAVDMAAVGVLHDGLLEGEASRLTSISRIGAKTSKIRLQVGMSLAVGLMRLRL